MSGNAGWRGESNVGIGRVYDQRPDLPRIPQAHVFPVLSAIDRFVNAGAVRSIAANRRLPRSDVNRVVVRWRYCNRANGGDVLLIEYWNPGGAAVCCFPDSACNRAEVPRVRLVRNAFDGESTTSPKWSNHSPAHAAEKFRINLRRRGGRNRWRGGWCG